MLAISLNVYIEVSGEIEESTWSWFPAIIYIDIPSR